MRRILAPLNQAVTFLYDYVVLFSLHWMYLGTMEDISGTRSDRRRSRLRLSRSGWHLRPAMRPTSGWISLIDEVAKRCYFMLMCAVACLYLGVTVLQNSFEPVPMTLGYIAMIMSLDGVLNSVVISTFMHLLKANEAMMHVFMDRMDHYARVKAAKIFAVPLSFILWCLVIMIACAVAYCTQANAPPLQLSGQRHGEILPNTASKHHSTSATGVAQPPLPQAALIILGHLTALVILRIVFIVHSIVRIRYVSKTEHATIDLESVQVRGSVSAVTVSDTPTTALVTITRKPSDAATPSSTQGGLAAGPFDTVWIQEVITLEPEEVPTAIGTGNDPRHQNGEGEQATGLSRRAKRGKKQSSSTGWVRSPRSAKMQSELRNNVNEARSGSSSGGSTSSSWTTDSSSETAAIVPETSNIFAES